MIASVHADRPFLHTLSSCLTFFSLSDFLSSRRSPVACSFSVSLHAFTASQRSTSFLQPLPSGLPFLCRAVLCLLVFVGGFTHSQRSQLLHSFFGADVAFQSQVEGGGGDGGGASGTMTMMKILEGDKAERKSWASSSASVMSSSTSSSQSSSSSSSLSSVLAHSSASQRARILGGSFFASSLAPCSVGCVSTLCL